MYDLANINLLSQSCKHYNKDTSKLSSTEITILLEKVSGWKMNESTVCIYKKFIFKNYYETISFVNAIAWQVHQQDHHPEITITYNTCHIEFSTHSIKGLSLNDFICAAIVDEL